MIDSPAMVNILLVEDNASDAELYIRALRKQNLANDLIWVKDGAEALDLLLPDDDDGADRRLPAPKVILLDLRLPKVDGRDVLKQLKANRTRTLPVVVLTSSKQDRDVVEAYGLGVNSFISKPVVFDEFVDTVVKLGLYWLVVNRPPC